MQKIFTLINHALLCFLLKLTNLIPNKTEIPVKLYVFLFPLIAVAGFHQTAMHFYVSLNCYL